MTEYLDSILIHEVNLDLRYLAGALDNENITPVFENSVESVVNRCKSHKFSAIILTTVESAFVDEKIISAISWSQNIFTPVIVVASDPDREFLAFLLRYKFELIRFPFTIEEFVFRVRRVIRLKQNEEAIHNNLLQHRTLFDTFPAGIVQTDQHGGFKGMNPYFTDLMEMSENELLKENFFQLCHPEDYFIERKQLDRLLRGELKTVNFEVRLINNDGKTSVCKIVANCVWEGDGNFSRFNFVLERVV